MGDTLPDVVVHSRSAMISSGDREPSKTIHLSVLLLTGIFTKHQRDLPVEHFKSFSILGLADKSLFFILARFRALAPQYV